MNISEIKPYLNNAKKHPESQVKKVADSIKAFGFNQPIVVDKDNVIIVGHGRYLAAQLLELKEVPVLKLNLTKEQTDAYRLADNKLNESEWDMQLVIDELKGLSTEMFNLTGFDSDLLIDADEKDDVLPEGVPSRSKLGDLYELGQHRVLCGDSTSTDDVGKLMCGQKADMVFTDPPYGIDYSGGRTQVVATKTYGKLKNDTLQGVDLGNLISQVFSFNKSEADVYICVSPIMQTPFLNFIENNDKKVDAVIVWDKKNAGLGYMAYRRQTEFILFIKGGAFHKGDKSDFDLWSIGKDNTSDYVHGTQKPVALSSRAIINSCKEEDIVLDFFLGSGSTLIASEKTKRICYGMELDPKYVDVIVQRYVDFVESPVVKLNGKIIKWEKSQKAVEKAEV